MKVYLHSVTCLVCWFLLFDRQSLAKSSPPSSLKLSLQSQFYQHCAGPQFYEVIVNENTRNEFCKENPTLAMVYLKKANEREEIVLMLDKQKNVHIDISSKVGRLRRRSKLVLKCGQKIQLDENVAYGTAPINDTSFLLYAYVSN